MSPAGGIERVVSKHIDFYVKDHNVTLLTKDALESFYALPPNIIKECLGINETLNMNSKFQRIYQILNQVF